MHCSSMLRYASIWQTNGTGDARRVSVSLPVCQTRFKPRRRQRKKGEVNRVQLDLSLFSHSGPQSPALLFISSSSILSNPV